jgi:hypothetical protein
MLFPCEFIFTLISIEEEVSKMIITFGVLTWKRSVWPKTVKGMKKKENIT